MKTFQEFLDECLEILEEGPRRSSGGTGSGTLTSSPARKMTRQERTIASIARRAGIRGTGKYSTKDLRTKPKEYTTYDSEDELDDIGSTKQDHSITTYASPRVAAKHEAIRKKSKGKMLPSRDSVRRVKDFRKNIVQSGGNKRGKVHTVDILHRDPHVVKGDPENQMERGRNFIKAVKDTQHQLRKVGAKKGEVITGRPTAVLPGETTDLNKKKKGEMKRETLYKKIFGGKISDKSRKTGMMIAKVH